MAITGRVSAFALAATIGLSGCVASIPTKTREEAVTPEQNYGVTSSRPSQGAVQYGSAACREIGNVSEFNQAEFARASRGGRQSQISVVIGGQRSTRQNVLKAHVVTDDTTGKKYVFEPMPEKMGKFYEKAASDLGKAGGSVIGAIAGAGVDSLIEGITGRRSRAGRTVERSVGNAGKNLGAAQGHEIDKNAAEELVALSNRCDADIANGAYSAAATVRTQGVPAVAPVAPR